MPKQRTHSTAAGRRVTDEDARDGDIMQLAKAVVDGARITEFQAANALCHRLRVAIDSESPKSRSLVTLRLAIRTLEAQFSTMVGSVTLSSAVVRAR
ncbi:MAG: hypothetical protein WC773_00230 [Patescibacteria group bacterium]